MTTATKGLADLAALALAEVLAHAPRTPGRRAAAHVWACLITTSTPDAARRAIAGFGEPETRRAAGELLADLGRELRGPDHLED